MISALLPTRGRPDSLRRSIASLIELADRPDQLEIAVAVDEDDPHAEAAHGVVNEVTGAHSLLWIAHERHGYSQLHQYYNALAQRAGGDWLMLWNDDALMTSRGWDTAITILPDPVVVADLWCPPHSPWLITFPAVRRWAVELLGAFSRHTCHCDTYWEIIGRGIPGGTVPVKGATVWHDRNDLTGGHNDTTWQEGQAGYRREHFYSEIVQAQIRYDLEVVKSYHARLGLHNEEIA